MPRPPPASLHRATPPALPPAGDLGRLPLQTPGPALRALLRGRLLALHRAAPRRHSGGHRAALG
eukprot:416422-Lingulodinium_polyedra.AAC.1